jgi:TPP-dependent pyruvate/acetoin dehydrogenase alpha subunit
MSTSKMSEKTLGLPSSVLLEMYEKMVLIRTFERVKVEGTLQRWRDCRDLHLAAGEEAVSVGVCANLSRYDYLTTTHRGHEHLLAKGSDVNKI